MKNVNRLLWILPAFVLALPGLARAQSPSPDRPCKQIVASCRAAGYSKGGHPKGKGLWKDCFQNVMDGKSVDGVSVEPGLVQACQAKKAAHKRSQ